MKRNGRQWPVGPPPHVMPADGDFAEVIKTERFRVINPEKMSVEQVKAHSVSGA